jgi:hypothetical protein
MATFLYRCPATGFNVQGYVSADPTDDAVFVPISCIVYTRIHLVNPKTGKVLGADEA